MSNDQNFIGRVYKIVNEREKLIYIGSTKQTLNSRFSNHKYKSKINRKGKTSNFYFYLNRNPENFEIKLIKEYEVSDKFALFAWEQLYINNYRKSKEYKCLNRDNALIWANERLLNIMYSNIKEGKIVKDKRANYRKVYRNEYENQIKMQEYQEQYREDPINKADMKRYQKAYRNKPENKLKAKEYREKHKQKLKVQRQNKEPKVTGKIKCACGSELVESSLRKHMKSKKHLNYLEKQKL